MSEDAAAWTMDTLGDTAAHLMGSNTYHDMSAHWPESDSVFRRADERPSEDRVLPQHDHGGVGARRASWPATSLRGREAHDRPRRLPAGPRRTRFAPSLVSTALIDQYRLLVHRAVLGDGKPILPGRMDFEPVSTTAFQQRRRGACPPAGWPRHRPIAGSAGADWWVAGAAATTAEDADVELDEVERFCTAHNLWNALT
jgi:hypothetical protein